MIKKPICQELFMKNQTNLRFLLALGNTKIVVLKDHDDLQVYSNHTEKRHKHTEKRHKNTVAAERLTEALTLR